MYQNIISSDIVSFRRYFVIGEYDNLDDAKANLDADVEKWKLNNKAYYKKNYPFARKYTKEEASLIPQLLAYTVMALEENPDQDFLGTIYTELGLVNKQHKQIFTPYNVSRLMAEITMGSVAQEVKEKGYITLNDDCCGAGSTLIAGVNTIKSILEKQGLNFQNHLLVAAQDIDLTVGLMCYIQLSLLGVAAYIKIDDAISNPMTVNDTLENYWFTPMYFSEVWKTRRMIKQMEQLFKEDK